MLHIICISNTVLFKFPACCCNLAAGEQLDVASVTQYDGETVFVACDGELLRFCWCIAAVNFNYYENISGIGMLETGGLQKLFVYY